MLPTEGDNHCAAKKAATQPSTDSTSNTRPRQTPTSMDSSSTDSNTQSATDTELMNAREWVSDKPDLYNYRLRMVAVRPSALTLAAALSASSLVAKGPTRTRVRLPSLLSAT